MGILILNAHRSYEHTFNGNAFSHIITDTFIRNNVTKNCTTANGSNARRRLIYIISTTNVTIHAKQIVIVGG